MQDLVNTNPYMRLVMPFVRTPTNLLRGVWAHTPVLGALQRGWREDFMAGGVRQSKAIGQWAVGGLVYSTVATYALEGRITGGGPSNPDQRKNLQASGWQPYSIVVNGPNGEKQYIQYARLDPIGMLMGLAADFVDAGKEMDEQTQSQTAAALVMAIAKNVTSKTYLTGVSDLIDTLQDPDRNAQRYVARFAASFVPNALNQVKQDPAMRESREILDAIRAKVPGLSESVAPRRNVLGDVVPATDFLGPNFLSPFAYSKSLPEDVTSEIARLRHGFKMPQEKLMGVSLRDFKDAKGQDAYDRLMELVSTSKLGNKTLRENLERLIQSPGYQRLPDQGDGVEPTGRIERISQYLDISRAQAMAKLRKERPEVHQALLAAQKQAQLGRRPVATAGR
jgi:hypothetical protein